LVSPLSLIRFLTPYVQLVTSSRSFIQTLQLLGFNRADRPAGVTFSLADEMHTSRRLHMTLIGFLILLLIAAVAGSLGQALAGYSLGGCLISIVVGFIGAWLGLWIARQFGLPMVFTIQVEGESFPVFWAVIGSAILTALVGLITRGPRRTYA
jgi:uncharacterized membrane protein YeaQ/YmgE (transglycosylase-associated protein family)